jgi:GNAT superfamily N-acetyltransferase
MAARDVVIRRIGSEERGAWEPLWKAYQVFYAVELSETANDTAWRRLHDPAEPMHGLGAYVDGRMGGIAHYLFHRSFWSVGDYCYLQDLFVAPDARKLGLARALIAAVEAEAREAGASRLHWLTQDHNQTARALYDQVAERSGFIQYRKML